MTVLCRRWRKSLLGPLLWAWAAFLLPEATQSITSRNFFGKEKKGLGYGSLTCLGSHKLLALLAFVAFLAPSSRLKQPSFVSARWDRQVRNIPLLFSS